jgi:hypothetical protein
MSLWIGFGENCRPNSVFGLPAKALLGPVVVVGLGVSLRISVAGTGLIATGLLACAALAGKPVDQPPNERAVFVTGSLIPQRIKLKPVGTTTVSPIRIIDRREIDATGRQTARGALVVADPSVRTIAR